MNLFSCTLTSIASAYQAANDSNAVPSTTTGNAASGISAAAPVAMSFVQTAGGNTESNSHATGQVLNDVGHDFDRLREGGTA